MMHKWFFEIAWVNLFCGKIIKICLVFWNQQVIVDYHLGDSNGTYLCSFASGSESLLYHLSELKGMASWKQKYEPLGLDAAGIEGIDWISP